MTRGESTVLVGVGLGDGGPDGGLGGSWWVGLTLSWVSADGCRRGGRTVDQARAARLGSDAVRGAAGCGGADAAGAEQRARRGGHLGGDPAGAERPAAGGGSPLPDPCATAGHASADSGRGAGSGVGRPALEARPLRAGRAHRGGRDGRGLPGGHAGAGGISAGAGGQAHPSAVHDPARVPADVRERGEDFGAAGAPEHRARRTVPTSSRWRASAGSRCARRW
jgi:hypothetical protein